MPLAVCFVREAFSLGGAKFGLSVSRTVPRDARDVEKRRNRTERAIDESIHRVEMPVCNYNVFIGRGIAVAFV